jgi:glycosyltransferase involved in cell wall biosynthesis
MKIAVIGAKGIPPRQGGIEHYCAEVYPRMVAQGHTVDLFARSSYTNLPAYHEYDFNGVNVVAVPCPGYRGFDCVFSSALGAVLSSRQIYDIVHFHALVPALFTWLPKIASSAQIVVTCQGLDWQRDKWGKASSQLILLGEKAAVRFADSIIVVSEALRSYFQQTYDRATVYIPNGPAGYADSDPNFAYGASLGLERQRYMIFLGRLVPEKCPDLLIKAFQRLQPPGWKLVLVGGNSDTSSYISKLTELAAANSNVLFTGELRGKYLSEIVRNAGLFVLPSKLEGLPLAMLEAMYEGIPVVGSDILPHQQLLTQKRGLLFQSENLDSCMQQINWAIHHPQEMKVMAGKAQQYVKLNYNWDHITAENLRLYETLMEPLYFPGKPQPQLVVRNS